LATVVFVSHSHSDEVLAEALVELLLSALELEPSAVRCTSVPGHQLQFGKTISEALKTDIETSAAILVLLTEDSLRSNWVLFELGASWALGRIIIPILGHNQTPKVLPGPLSGYPCVAIDASDASSRMADAISQIAVTLGLRERSGGAREAKLRKFFDKAQAESEKKTRPELGQAMAFEIPLLILAYASHRFLGQLNYLPALIPQIEFYLTRLGIQPRNPLESYLDTEDQGATSWRLIAELGGALAARRPDLIPFYDAGAHLGVLSRDGKREDFKIAVERMQLPESLVTPQENLQNWLNDIHDYFNQELRQE
jgi:hypothetical protein